MRRLAVARGGVDQHVLDQVHVDRVGGKPRSCQDTVGVKACFTLAKLPGRAAGRPAGLPRR